MFNFPGTFEAYPDMKAIQATPEYKVATAFARRRFVNDSRGVYDLDGDERRKMVEWFGYALQEDNAILRYHLDQPGRRILMLCDNFAQFQNRMREFGVDERIVQHEWPSGNDWKIKGITNWRQMIGHNRENSVVVVHGKLMSTKQTAMQAHDYGYYVVEEFCH